MKKILLILVLLVSGFVSKAQQDPMYSMYMFNHMAINPAYAGSLDHLQAVGLFRRQWLDFPGSPRTANLTVHAPTKNEQVGLGFSFVNDQVGDMSTNAFMAAYAYHLKFKKSRLSLGLQAGARNFSLNLNEIQLSPDQGFDEAFQGNISQWSFNFGAGAFWYSDNWYVSLGIPNLRNNIISAQQVQTTYVARNRTHANLSAGFVTELSPIFKLKPSFMIKQVAGAPVQVDLNANLYWLDIIGLGLSYRSGDALVTLLEIQLNRNLRIGYAYDQTVSKLSGNVGGTHEIMLRTDFGFNKNKTLTPRYF
ncbi:MAG: type IX secretion system membrane protein PorP/SprF [Bacteroidia bacterium]